MNFFTQEGEEMKIEKTPSGSYRVRQQSNGKRYVATFDHKPTQKEAIEYAKKLADNADSSIVIHKEDGKIRKQDYSKK